MLMFRHKDAVYGLDSRHTLIQICSQGHKLLSYLVCLRHNECGIPTSGTVRDPAFKSPDVPLLKAGRILLHRVLCGLLFADGRKKICPGSIVLFFWPVFWARMTGVLIWRARPSNPCVTGFLQNLSPTN